VGPAQWEHAPDSVHAWQGLETIIVNKMSRRELEEEGTRIARKDPRGGGRVGYRPLFQAITLAGLAWSPEGRAKWASCKLIYYRRAGDVPRPFSVQTCPRGRMTVYYDASYK